jgi:twitching motility protein PilT
MVENISQKVENLLQVAIEKKASDLHISVGHPPILRIMGALNFFPEFGVIDSNISKEITNHLMNENQKQKFSEEKEIDFSYEFKKEYRFRVNVFIQRGCVSCSFRLISTNIQKIEDLNLPPILNKFCESKQGLVLIVGPSSHGKSTTLAAMIEKINKEFFKRIITIEDPIEYIFKDDKSVIDQREVHYDTSSFKKALKSIFRQDPDIIVVGEMRDPETIATTITAAETGHLVFSTIHTNSASESIHRIIDSFPAAQQNQIRAQLATSLLGIISQRLVPRKNGGLIPACEILISNSASANIIREGRIHELDLVIETSSNQGMISLNQSLMNLVNRDEVLIENALLYSRKPGELKKTFN